MNEGNAETTVTPTVEATNTTAAPVSPEPVVSAPMPTETAAPGGMPAAETQTPMQPATAGTEASNTIPAEAPKPSWLSKLTLGILK